MLEWNKRLTGYDDTYSKNRHQNEDEAVRLDYKRDHQENLKEIFVNITKVDVPKSKKLGYYNAYVRLCHRVGPFQELVFTKEEMLVCLRQGLFCKLKETRAACLRSLRYFCHDWSTMSALLRLRIDYLIVRSIDICLDNDVERVHAMKLIRKLISIRPDKFPSSLLNPLISIANDGTKVRDKLVKTCLATVCELAIYNPKLVAQQGGISAILHNVLEYHHQPRINESLMATILHLLNHPSTRHFIKANVDLEQMLAPFTDFDYRYSLELSDQLGTESEFKYDACKMALATIIKSWPGMIRLCKPDSSGLRSLIGMLYLPNLETRREIMDVLFDVFRFAVPDWTDDFAQAIASIDPSQMTESWKLSNGFVVEEAKCLLPHMTKTRPNLVDNHASLILSAFIKAGLFEALVETITTGSVHLSIRATVLLGKLLYLSGNLLPDSVRHYNQCLPSLIEKTTKPNIPASQKIQACMAVNNLASLHAMKQRGLVASSLYLKELLNNHTCAAGKKNYRRYKTGSQYTDKDRDSDLIMQAVRDSQVLYSKNKESWDWELISTILKWPDNALRFIDTQAQRERFIRRLLNVFKPSSKIYSTLELTKEERKKMTTVGLNLIDYVVDFEQIETEQYLLELLIEINECLIEVLEQKNVRDMLFTPSHLMQTCSQYYFLFIGRLSSTDRGSRILTTTSIHDTLSKLASSMVTADAIIKLITSNLDCSRDGPSRNIISKALTLSSENGRIYSTAFFRVLLRARTSSFNHWCIELLIGQLQDPSKAVAMEALSVLSESCEDLKNLQILIKLRPDVSHLGYKGDLLVTRFMSLEKSYRDLLQDGTVAAELEKWHLVYNIKYVETVEERLVEALTTYEKTYDGSYVRRSHKRVPRKNVLVPIHLYGQLVQHEEGVGLLMEQPYLVDLFDTIRYMDLRIEMQIVKVKAALWAVGHIGTSEYGLKLLKSNHIIQDIIKLAEDSGVFTIRGTSFYALGLIASTRSGANILHELGWEAVRHAHVIPHRLGTASPHVLRTESGSIQRIVTSADESIDNICAASKTSNSTSHKRLSCTKGLEEDRSPTRTETEIRLRLPSVGEGEENAEGERNVIADVHIKDSNLLRSPGHDLEGMQTTDDVMLSKSLNGRGISRTYSNPSGETAMSSGASSLATDVIITSRQSSCGSGDGYMTSPSMAVSRQSLPVGTLDELTDFDRKSLSNDQTSAARRDANLKQIPHSIYRHSVRNSREPGSTHNDHTSAQDLAGYVTLRGLKSVHVGSEFLTPDRHFYDEHLSVNVKKTRSLDFRSGSKARSSLRNLMPRLSFREKIMSACRSMRPVSSASMDVLGGEFPFEDEGNTDLDLAPSETDRSCISQNEEFELTRNRAQYCGICLPINISMIFQVNEGEDLRSQVSDNEADVMDLEDSKSENKVCTSSRSFNDSGLMNHSSDNCLGCIQAHRMSRLDKPLEQDDKSSTGCSTKVATSNSSTRVLPSSLASFVDPDGVERSGVGDDLTGDNQTMIRKEVLRFVVNLSTSVGVKGSEQGLLILKQKFPDAFQDLCLYSEISFLLSRYNFRLSSRRFIQELFQDLFFTQCLREPHSILDLDEEYLQKLPDRDDEPDLPTFDDLDDS